MILIPSWLADLGLRLNRLYYKQKFEALYMKGNPPSWFDHRIDLHYLWPQNLFWLERGILPRKYMFRGCSILDLFCGDGFYSRYFYSTIAGSIDAVDKDPAAIAHASHLHSHSSIRYKVLDVVYDDFPASGYDLVVWFEAIEHLKVSDYKIVIKKIKSAMDQKGILFGSTPIVPEEKKGQGNWEHENEFSSVEDLSSFLLRDFGRVQIDVTVYPDVFGQERRTAYFTATQPLNL